MNAPSGRVWTRTDNGWATREPNPGDHWRRAILSAWISGEHIVDQVTLEGRPMTYADAAKGIAAYGITEPECAA